MQIKGLTKTEALARVMMFDTQGVVVADRKGLTPEKAPFAHKQLPTQRFNPLDVSDESPHIVATINSFKPTILIGVSTMKDLFTRDVVEAMSGLNKRPIIFSLSNHDGKDGAHARAGLRLV